MIRLALSLLLLAAFALPLYWPPAGGPLSIPPPDSGLLQRVFAGLPAGWVIARLACLIAGAVLFPTAPLATTSAPSRAMVSADGKLRRALYLTLAICAASFFIDQFNRPLQLAYIAALFLPALIARRGTTVNGGAGRGSAVAILIVVAAWLLIRLPLTLHSARSADAVDMTLAFDALERAANPGLNVITEGIQAGGITALHLIPQGIGILGWGGIPLSVTVVQLIHLTWDAVAGVIVGLVAARLIGATAGPIATAALLFSPYMLATPYFLGAVFLGPLTTGGLLFLYLRVRDHGAVAALLLMAPLAGIAATHPGLAPVAVGLFGLTLWSLWRTSRSWLGLIVPALLFVITLGRSLPLWHHLGGLASSMTQARAQWSAMEAGLFGQFATSLGETATRVAQPGILDVPFGAILAPFFVPPTPMRLWGWNLFEPIATVLAAIGIAVCARNLMRHGLARGLLVLLALALLPGFASTYDRPSLTRMFVLPVPMALLAAVGFEQVRRLLAPRAGAALVGTATAVLIGGGGLWLFDMVHPRLLPHSANAIAIEVVQTARSDKVLLLRHPGWDLEEVELYAREVPRRPLPVKPFEGIETFAGIEPDLILWSPALEDDLGVSAAVCRRWRQVVLYVFSDAAGRSKLFAAQPLGGGSPGEWPTLQVESARCGMALPTEEAGARKALAEAERFIKEGRTDKAVDRLRSTAERSFVAVTLFETLAGLLMQRNELEAAEYWAWRAALPKSGETSPHLTLAEIRAARGDIDGALESARRGVEIAESAGDRTTAGEAERLLQSLETRRGGA